MVEALITIFVGFILVTQSARNAKDSFSSDIAPWIPATGLRRGMEKNVMTWVALTALVSYSAGLIVASLF